LYGISLTTLEDGSFGDRLRLDATSGVDLELLGLFATGVLSSSVSLFHYFEK